MRWCSSNRVPRTLVATSAPIAESETARIARATSTSTSVKPSVPPLAAILRNNLNSPRHPIHAHLVRDTLPAQGDNPAAGHSSRKKTNDPTGSVLAATGRQQGIHLDVLRHSH